MNSVQTMIYQKNVAPESDAQILVDAVYDAIEAFGGAERFAQTLATGYLVDEQRKAA